MQGGGGQVRGGASWGGGAREGRGWLAGVEVHVRGGAGWLGWRCT